MIILGLNAYHGDSSACIVVDGKLIAAVEEERFTRIKHWAGLPVQAINYCLQEAGVTLGDVDHIAINRDPKANFMKKALFAFYKRPSLRLVTDRLKNAGKVKDIKEELIVSIQGSRVRGPESKAQVHNVEHHIAHLASSFFVSPFEEAVVVSVDGFGDFVGAMWGVAKGNKIEVKHRTFFPHSLGLFYLAFTQYLGFCKYGDEYKVMGLAAYGEPEYMKEMRQIVKITDDNFNLNLDYFIHHSEGVTMTWENGEPKMGPVFSKKLEEFLGPARKNGKEIEKRHKNLAASLQRRYEEVLFNILNRVYKKTDCPNLVLSGGCAMNSVANGKIFQNTPFRKVYIQPAAGDAGGSIGAAYYVWNQVLNKPRSFVLEKPYLGSDFSDDEVSNHLSAINCQLKENNCSVQHSRDVVTLCRTTAQHIAEGKVIGWFQGRMEWGPRALGNRSIIGDPRRSDMKNILNLKIKRRESFRPFAPSIHLDAVGEYFETSYPDPFMLKVYKIKPEKREIIPAVTHVDGTGRLQTVRKEDNPIYWQLIEEFRKITGIPVLLNTSFNENEPIVCKPEEALDCFLRTKMDVLVMGSYFVERADNRLEIIVNR
ncbi:MAG: carbamoyltransferase [Nitrospiraceae bacterium]|nr:MAG: carbamoyltransferase [Nitrospiraceae bacterium]